MRYVIFMAALMSAFMLGALEVIPEKQYLKTGETAVFNIALDPGRGSQMIDVVIRGSREIQRDIKIRTDADGKAQLNISADRPGFIYVQVSDAGAQAAAGVAVDKDAIRPARSKPAAFDKFWNDLKNELQLLPMRYEISEIPGRKGFKTYEVKLLLGGEGKDAYCILTMPENSAPGRMAAAALFHGHGVDKITPEYRNDAIVLSVNPMSVKHDGKTGSTIREPEGQFYMYRYWGTDELDKNYFVGMFRRNYQALQFLKTLPEWDQRTLIVFGASQGGAQALVAAGMDPDVTYCAALLPALCNHGGYEAGGESGWPRYHETEVYQNDPDKSLAVTDFVDAAFFAMNIRNAEVYVSVGFIDRTCPPESVYAAYNVIPAPAKRIRDELYGHHQTRHAAYREMFIGIRNHIRKMQSEFRR